MSSTSQLTKNYLRRLPKSEAVYEGPARLLHIAFKMGARYMATHYAHDLKAVLLAAQANGGIVPTLVAGLGSHGRSLCVARLAHEEVLRKVKAGYGYDYKLTRAGKALVKELLR